MDDLARWGPLTDFEVVIPETWYRTVSWQLALRIERAMTQAKRDLPTEWDIGRIDDRFGGPKFVGRAPSALVAVLGACAQGHDPTPLLERLGVV